MVYTRKSYLMHDLGVPPFMETSIYDSMIQDHLIHLGEIRLRRCPGHIKGPVTPMVRLDDMEILALRPLLQT